MAKQTFQSELIEMGARCEAVEWVGDRTLQEAWDQCERADWMLWLLEQKVGQVGWPNLQTLIHCGCDCAESVQHLIPASENRPRLAIEAARRCADNPTKENQDAARSAADAARSAADAAWSAAVVDAAWSAAGASWSATRAARSAVVAAGVAARASWSATRASGSAVAAVAARAVWFSAEAEALKHLELCALIRKRVPIPYREGE